MEALFLCQEPTSSDVVEATVASPQRLGARFAVALAPQEPAQAGDHADRLVKRRPIIVHGDGSSLWVVTHADDFARGFVGLLGNGRALGEAFHITSDEVLTWNQIYETIGAALGVDATVVHVPSDFIAQVVPELSGSLLGDKTWSVVFDNTKIRAFVPGFRASIPFRDGIRRTLEWFGTDERRRLVDETVNADMDRILEAYAGGCGRE